MTKFYKMYEQFEESGLKPTQVSVMAHLYDRMSLSIKNDFKDENGEYFVIYTVKTLAEKINVDSSTISRVFSSLEKSGWIEIKRSRKADVPNFIKLPKYDFNELEEAVVEDNSSESRETNVSSMLQNAMSGVAKCNASYTNNIYTDKHINTVNTEKPENDFKIDQQRKLQMWENATLNIGLRKSAVDRIKLFSKNNVIVCKAVVRIILNARNSVAKANGLENSKESQFESNLNLQYGLTSKLDHIFRYIEKNGYKDYAGYLTNALKPYFEKAFGVEPEIETVKPNMKRNLKVKETLPDWAKDDYKPKNYGKVNKYKKAELEARIAALSKGHED